MIRGPVFEWRCEGCRKSGIVTPSRRGASVDFLNHVIAEHRRKAPECTAATFALRLPIYRLLSSVRWTRAVQEEEAAARKAKKKKAAG
jgi:hypothetical protein